MFREYFKDWNNLAKAEREFHEKHWLGEIILTVGGFAVCGAGLAIVGAIDNMKKKKEQPNEESVDEPVEEQVV
jgi:hypothetical protein